MITKVRRFRTLTATVRIRVPEEMALDAADLHDKIQEALEPVVQDVVDFISLEAPEESLDDAIARTRFRVSVKESGR